MDFRMTAIIVLKTYVLITFNSFALGEIMPCIPKYFGHENSVCVCNATYCDTLEPLRSLPPTGHYYKVTSSKEGKRFYVTRRSVLDLHADCFFEECFSNETEILHSKFQYQEILGFGGAFTDATGI
jgi:glucosylceramidase